MVDITETVPMVLIAIVSLTAILIFFLLPMLFEVFIGRNFCKFLGFSAIAYAKENSLLIGLLESFGITEAGINFSCNMLPF